MTAYKGEVERAEKERKQRLEKANNLEKGWELLRLCRDYLRENSTEWTDRQEDEKQKKLEEESKVERLKTCERERRKFEKVC